MTNSRQPNNSHSSGQGIGKGMIVIAMVMLLGLLTLIFQDALDKQYNPNQNIHSSLSDNHAEITLKRNRSGHYVGTGKINGHSTVFLLDTGATYVAVPERVSQRLGLDKGQAIRISTANGRTTGYQTIIQELKIGPIMLNDIKAIITPNLEEVLLGMSVLKQLEFTQRGNELTIRQYL